MAQGMDRELCLKNHEAVDYFMSFRVRYPAFLVLLEGTLHKLVIPHRA